MPALWTMDRLCVSQPDLLGALAKWAVRLSPYTVPSNLAKALEEFTAEWRQPDSQWDCNCWREFRKRRNGECQRWIRYDLYQSMVVSENGLNSLKANNK